MKGSRAAEHAEKNRIWQKRLEDWKRSGLTQVQYCRQNNLGHKNFLYWKKKILPNSGTATLVELSANLLRPSGPPNSSHLNLIIDGRFHVEVLPGFDADTLDRLIRVLNRS